MGRYKYIRRHTVLYMGHTILDPFSDSPSQERVVRFLLENGFGISDSGRIVVNGIEISATAISRVIGVDRRVVDTTVKRILEMDDIKTIFARDARRHQRCKKSRPLGHHQLPEKRRRQKYVASAVAVLADHDLPLRQIFVTYPYIAESPKLVLIIDGTLPAAAIKELRALPAVDTIIL